MLHGRPFRLWTRRSGRGSGYPSTRLQHLDPASKGFRPDSAIQHFCAPTLLRLKSSSSRNLLTTHRFEVSARDPSFMNHRDRKEPASEKEGRERRRERGRTVKHRDTRTSGRSTGVSVALTHGRDQAQLTLNICVIIPDSPRPRWTVHGRSLKSRVFIITLITGRHRSCDQHRNSSMITDRGKV